MKKTFENHNKIIAELQFTNRMVLVLQLVTMYTAMFGKCRFGCSGGGRDVVGYRYTISEEHFARLEYDFR
jgi:hypothetical protein